MSKLSGDWEDVSTNGSQNESLPAALVGAIDRRGFLKASSQLALTTFLTGSVASQVSAAAPAALPGLIGFSAVGFSTADEVVVAAGYKATPFLPWGTPLFSQGEGAQWKGDGSDSAAAQARQMGDNHDGMHFFPLTAQSSSEGLLVMNHEYTTTIGAKDDLYVTLFGATPTAVKNSEMATKAINAWGCSVAHIKKDEQGRWILVTDSKYNRRITAATPMQLTGPAAASQWLKTNADPSGTKVLGTINNCGNGFTPWGTYLTCEENFNSNFGTALAPEIDQRQAVHKRYGINSGLTGYGWERFDDRFDYKKEPNESNRFGWVVEINPFDPQSTPKKRTALGRIKHENAAHTLSADGRVVIYMGDDQADEYVYKFVSDGKFIPGNLTANERLLDSGQLFVAKFNTNLKPSKAGEFSGQGEWVLLDKARNPLLQADERLPDQAAVLTFARWAADTVGATKMDRPEWVAVHPKTGEAYVTLTNNKTRASVNEANPRVQNVYGHIVRWREQGKDAAATRFDWDIFVLAGNPTVAANVGTLKAGSVNIDAANTFNSPDGIGFDASGRLWIQTDGNYSNAGNFAGQGNNQMLAADPGTGEIRRFLVGPKECEITGMTFTPDGKTMFVNVQHPGETGSGASHWPDGGNNLPRSATLVITKNDGGVIGT